MASDQHDNHFEEDIQAYTNVIVQDLPGTQQRLEEFKLAQENDPLCQEVAWYCQEGWLEKGRDKGMVKQYYPVLSEILILHVDSLLMRIERIIIPSMLQKQVLDQINTGHQSIISVVTEPDSKSGGLDYLQN